MHFHDEDLDTLASYTRDRVRTVLGILGKISDPQDHGVVSLNGRVITASAGHNGCEIVGTFKICGSGHYTLTFELRTFARTPADGIMRAAATIAEFQSRAPQFEQGERDAILEALAQAFGPLQGSKS